MGKTGTRAFMAIGVLLGEQHSFMHDLESFIWVLFWICIYYSGPGEAIGPTEYDSWNYESDGMLVASKIGEIADEEVFLKKADMHLILPTTVMTLLVPRLPHYATLLLVNAVEEVKEQTRIPASPCSILSHGFRFSDDTPPCISSAYLANVLMSKQCPADTPLERFDVSYVVHTEHMTMLTNRCVT
ncbi:hypothetical protein VTK26DRAFT_672 [Humicola hyalothermophila]